MSRFKVYAKSHELTIALQRIAFHYGYGWKMEPHHERKLINADSYSPESIVFDAKNKTLTSAPGKDADYILPNDFKQFIDRMVKEAKTNASEG